jgi:hypothetical protein
MKNKRYRENMKKKKMKTTTASPQALGGSNSLDESSLAVAGSYHGKRGDDYPTPQ